MRGLTFDVVILDVMMPGESGLELARELKATRPIPICMLTARAEPEQRIEGLETGVDDYVSKPFEPRELLLRLHNILRRGQAPPVRATRSAWATTFQRRTRRAEAQRARPSSSPSASAICCACSRSDRRADARHELASDDSTGSERAIDVQINRLRRKIETDPSNPVYLQTVRGKGYILYTD